jgi:hypothetical protein
VSRDGSPIDDVSPKAKFTTDLCSTLHIAFVILVAVAVAAGSTGYVLGTWSSTSSAATSPSSLPNTSQPAAPAKPSSTESTEGSLDSDSDYEDEVALVKEGKLGTLRAGKLEECKLVLVVNQELGMGKGKIAAQCRCAESGLCASWALLGRRCSFAFPQQAVTPPWLATRHWRNITRR